MKKVVVRRHYSEVTLATGTKLRLGPYVYLRKGDVLEFFPTIRQFRLIRKQFTDKGTGKISRVVVFPPYSVREVIHLPPHKLAISFKERTTAAEWQSAKVLEQFHYRGKGFNRLVGRRVCLLAVSEEFGVVAYGVLSATVAMAKPRFELFRTNFTKQMNTGLINQIARIPRIVVHPEFRGMGIGVLMARHLVRYARKHWDINGYRAIMVEVIAKMTEYHKFFERAGFTALGYTEGYDEGIRPQYGNGKWGERNDKHFDFLEKQKPKPYLIWPLSESVHRKVLRVLGTPGPHLERSQPLPPSARPIVLHRVSAAYRASNGTSDRTELVKDAFGIDSSQLTSTVLRELDVSILPGEIVLVTGASGSGKSSFLELVSRSTTDLKTRMQIKGRVKGVSPDRVAFLTTLIRSRGSLIDQVGSGRGVREAIDLLNSVGLAEANLYLKCPNQLSDGQLYRFAVARLCDSRRTVWVADEFTAALNAEMAAVVAKGIRRLARKYGATVILAAAHINTFVDSLVPTKLLRLKWGGASSVHSLRVHSDEKQSSLALRITNTCASELHDLTVDALDLCGQLVRLKKRALLEPGSDWVASLSKGRLSDATMIRVYSRELVGEMVYLRKRLP